MNSTKTAGTEGYEQNIAAFVENCQALDFHIVCKELLEYLPAENSRILDVGAGAGQNAAALDGLGFDVTAIDPMSPFIDAARRTYPESSVKWLSGSLPHLACLTSESGCFDFVLIEGVWHHLNEAERAIAAGRVSELVEDRGGRCAISLRNGPAGLGSRVYPTDTEATINLFESLGFECIFKVQNLDSILPGKEDVKWSRIVLQRVSMTRAYPVPPKRLRDLNGFGPRSEEILAEVDINSIEDFMAIDPFELYAKIKPMKGMGLNSIYAIIGARENVSWLEIKNTRKTEILMRLDDMGLAPK